MDAFEVSLNAINTIWQHLHPIEMVGIDEPVKLPQDKAGYLSIRKKHLSKILALETGVKKMLGSEVKHGDFNMSLFLQCAQKYAHMMKAAELVTLQKIVLMAEISLLEAPPELEENIGLPAPWMTKWKRSLINISSGAVQKVWKDLLVTQLGAKENIGLATLDVAEGLDEEKIELLHFLCSICLKDFVYRNSGNFLIEHMDKLHQLEAYGFLQGVHGKVLSKHLTTEVKGSYQHTLKGVGGEVALTSGQQRMDFIVPAFLVSSSVVDLVSLMKTPLNETYMKKVVADLESRGLEVSRA
jgi:hypothetical protein